MLDHIIGQTLPFTGTPDLATASLTFTALDDFNHVTINARALDADDLQTLTEFLTDLTSQPETAARRFLDMWQRGRAREAVKTLTGICTVRLDLRIDLTGQADQWPEILAQSTITDTDVRDHLGDYDDPIEPGTPEYERTLKNLRAYNDSDAMVEAENAVIDACVVR